MRLFRSADLSQVPTTIGKSWLGNVILKAEGIGKPTILPIFSRASKPYFRGQDYAVLISALQRNPQNADLVQSITILVGAESNEARAQMAATLPTVSLRRQK